MPRRVPVWSVILVCFFIIVIVMAANSVLSQTAYETFYEDFAEEYSLLIHLVEIKQDLQDMDIAVSRIVGSALEERAEREKSYEEHFLHARSMISLLKAQLEKPILYIIIDIENMLVTFDENYRLFLSKLETDYLLYLSTDIRYLKRLKSYIDEEIATASATLTVKAQAAYLQFSDRLESIQNRNFAGMVCSVLFCMMYAFWMTQSVSKPMRTLVKRMRRFADTGEDDLTEKQQTRIREVGELIDSYDVLVVETIQKREVERELARQQLDNLQTRALLKSAELDVLRMQMDPHFLLIHSIPSTR